MRLLSSDYDGTLKDGLVNLKFNIRALRKFIKHGNLFLLNTGRPFDSIKEEIKIFNIPYSYLSCSDGTILYDNQDNLLYYKHIEDDTISEVISLIKAFNRIYNENINYQLDKVDDHIIDVHIIIGEIDEPKKDFLELLLELTKSYEINLSGSVEHGHIYVVKKCTKSTPIKFIQDFKNIDRCDIFSVGDNWNDVEMIKEYNGFAIKSSRLGQQNKYATIDSVGQLVKLIDVKKKK